MINGGNILVLQCILGHQSITMTMRHVHFAPALSTMRKRRARSSHCCKNLER
ncbi:hypothetical protein [Halomonas maura]|uniref:hypothetical protein n=1 Tax=Halomonas maura TaxID=117606 RepID=UPI0025B3A084|nr:hypothetical protein [Halomonas maura]MDN3554621.1 hypothetical protein [Halomonas maura]